LLALINQNKSRDSLDKELKFGGKAGKKKDTEQCSDYPLRLFEVSPNPSKCANLRIGMSTEVSLALSDSTQPSFTHVSHASTPRMTEFQN
jgi:hypothetical protein